MFTLYDEILKDSEKKALSPYDGVRMLGISTVFESKLFTTPCVYAANKYIEALKIIQTMREMLRDPQDCL
jgi:hypothetical protein